MLQMCGVGEWVGERVTGGKYVMVFAVGAWDIKKTDYPDNTDLWQ